MTLAAFLLRMPTIIFLRLLHYIALSHILEMIHFYVLC